jgi:hypothetical protein
MLIVVLWTAQMLVGEIIGNTVTGSLALVTNAADVDASQNRGKCGQVPAMPAKQIPYPKIKLRRGPWAPWRCIRRHESGERQ